MNDIADDRRVIVVGSGLAGAAAAEALLAQGIPVTMLESADRSRPGLHLRLSGEDFFVPTLKRHDMVPCISRDDSSAVWQTTLALGGLSNYWTLQVVRFQADDFTEGERVDERYVWPLRYDELVPYYERIEHILDVLGSDKTVAGLPACRVTEPRSLPEDWGAVAQGAERGGQALVHRPVVRGRRFAASESGTAYNSYVHLIRRFAKRAPFRLVTGAHVSHLEWDGRRVTQAVYFDRGTATLRRIAGRAFVLAAGPIGSPRILLNSTSSDFPQGLGNAEGVLGAYFHDHPKAGGSIRLGKPLSRLRIGAYLARPPHAASPPLMAAACTIQSVKLARGLLRRSLALRKTTGINFWQFGTMIPKEQHRITLSTTERDEFGVPLPEIGVRFDEDARRALATARERMLQYFDDAGCAPTMTSFAQEPPGAAVHYGGAARMHASPRYGMLDARHRLHAAPNVLVVDASCWPTTPEKNPTLTIMAMASRAGELLAGDLRAS
ncbi:MAG TPA: GMC family oxidoreductase [Polyangiaceae bacterium]